MNQIKVIEACDIRRVLVPALLIPAVERSLSYFSRGPNHSLGAVQPLRSTVPVDKYNGKVFVMPGYLPSENALATKVVSLFPNNSSMGVPTHSAVVVLMNPQTGQILAFVEGDSITELRTAASSAVASTHLAPDTVSKVAVLGAGTQGGSHARIHHFLYKPEVISIWSRDEKNSQKLVNSLVQEGIHAVVASSVEEATKDADIINTCTLASEPILWAKDIKEGVHINAVGAPRPDWRELDPEIVGHAIIYADSREAALNESGDIIQSRGVIHAEIGEVINKEKEAFREKTTIYKSLGIAVLDAAAARLAYDLLYK